MVNRLHRLGLAVGITVVLVMVIDLVGSGFSAPSGAPVVDVFFLDAPVAQALINTRIITPFVTTQLIYPNIVPGANFKDNRVKVAGIIDCTAGQTLQIRATITQGETVATSPTSTFQCTGHMQRWVVYVTASTGTLEQGTVNVHVWSKTLEDGDVFEWDRSVQLAGSEHE